jgi:glycerophosphoryl diester phosphodiesterase
MVFDGRRPVVIGHRGLGSGEVDGQHENTLGSFLAAAEAGADWVEVDVRRTRDDRLVVAHDPAYDDGLFLVDADAATASARGTLLLDELLEALPEHVGVNVDLKTSMEDATRGADATTVALIAPVAAREAHRRPLALTSFDPAALHALRSLAPDVPLGLLTWLEFPVGLAVAAAAHLDVEFLAVHMGSLRPNRIEPEPQQRPLDYVVSLLHEADREVLAWCPTPEELPRVVAAGVDAICVNDIPAILDLLPH